MTTHLVHTRSDLPAAFGSLTSLLRRRSLILALALALVSGAGSLLTGPPAYAQQYGTATVNINTADAAALAAGLTGVGLSRAEEIVRYRETFGPFSSVEELAEVKGIGTATVEKNRAVIVLD